MYIQIGTKEKPANIKVTGGFIVETPIAKIVNSNISASQYHGTPQDKFTKPLTDTQNLINTVGVSIVYFKSYEDYLNLESSITIDQLANTQPGSLISALYSLPLTDTIDELAIYTAVVQKLSETLQNVKIITE